MATEILRFFTCNIHTLCLTQILLGYMCVVLRIELGASLMISKCTTTNPFLVFGFH